MTEEEKTQYIYGAETVNTVEHKLRAAGIEPRALLDWIEREQERRARRSMNVGGGVLS